MNRLAVALAADSAVTFGGARDTKIYQSAEKLFQLSESDAVAIMVYGTADCLGVPWETIIKQYRVLHGHKSLATVREHAQAFIEFIETSEELLPSSLQQEHFSHGFGGAIDALIDAAESQMRDETTDGPITQDRAIELVEQAFESAATESREAISTNEELERFSETIRTEYQQQIADTIAEKTEALPLSPESIENLKVVASSFYHFLTSASGLVFAGFGHKNVFPSVLGYEIPGLAANMAYRRAERIQEESGAAVMPFAQGEMVYLFMEGIDPSLLRLLHTSLAEVFENLPDLVVDSLGSDDPDYSAQLKERLTAAASETVTALLSGLKEHRAANYSMPILAAVEALPKDELASLAESLVNLTVLRRRTSMEAETVGGPVDVAVITKGDGFVWIKRKHYFPAELNARYLARLGATRHVE